MNLFDKYSTLESLDKRFRLCREYLKENLEEHQKKIEMNHNLLMALQCHIGKIIEMMEFITHDAKESVEETETNLEELTPTPNDKE